MNMQQWAGDGTWFINMPLWAPAAFVLLIPLIFAFILWSVVWKGLALWHSARRKQPWWFVVFLIVNTLGILEIIYLFGVAKLKFSELFSSHEHRTEH